MENRHADFRIERVKDGHETAYRILNFFEKYLLPHFTFFKVRELLITAALFNYSIEQVKLQFDDVSIQAVVFCCQPTHKRHKTECKFSC